MLKRLLAVLALVFCPVSAWAGFFSTTNCNNIPAIQRIAYDTLCLQSTTADGRAAGTQWVWDGTAWISATAGSVPGGAAGDVQYSSAGTFGGEAEFNYTAAFNLLTVPSLNLTAAFALQGDITPTQITSDQNNYNPTGLSTAAVLRLDTDAPRSLTGLAGGADGRLLILYNKGSSSLTLVNASGLSTDLNRFDINSNITLAATQGIWLQYDSTSQRWRAASGISGGGGGGQAADDDLTALAALVCTGLVTRTASNTFTCRTITNAGGGLTITNPAGIAGNINIEPGSQLVRNDSSTTATSGAWDLGGLTSLEIPGNSGCAPTTDGQICQNTSSGDWYFARNSTAEVFVARSDMDAKTHSSFPDLEEDQHPNLTGFDASEGDPTAASVPRAGWFHFNTTSGEEDLFFGTATGGNFVRAGARLDRINQLTNGTLSASTSGPEAQLIVSFTTLSAKVLTFPKTETYAAQPSSGAIEIYADGATAQQCVVFGWTTGGDSSEGATETITLNGLTPVPSIKTNWEDIYAVHCPNNAATTISFRTDTGDLAIGSVASGATHSANALSLFFMTATGGGTPTQYVQMRLDAVENANANANATPISGTNVDYAAVRYVDSATGTSYWSAYVPVASTSWNMVLHNKPTSGTGTAVSLEVACRAVGNNEAWDSTKTWIQGTSGNPAEITVSSTSANLNVNTIAATLALSARDRLICSIARVGADANDNLSTTWDLLGVSLEITP